MLSTNNHHGNANQSHNEIAPHLLKGLLSERQKINAGQAMEQEELLCTVGGNVN
jgi:hypothetical protein